ncbi:MAG: wax ester/triacylglycerol synthase family O-acyltransferase [Halieaceae bacterium]|jgi:diacylglycerol O-acyltransferase / wax synthase|nr:wax ester/triacylglycerol synthase family O-acyltransferase [Halieaceae bacterium]
MAELKQLSGQDSTFLFLDTDRASTGGTLIYIYDQSTIPSGKLRFKQILSHIDSRIDSSPIFRQKLKRVPLNLDNPYWVTDKNFRLENHVSHVALPKPGDWRQFCILASRLTRPHFDMERPLWEMYVIEGLDNVDWLPRGSFAILTRLHHAAVDGTAAAELTWALHDLSPGGENPEKKFASPGETRSPSNIEMAARVWWNNTLSPLRLARPLSHALPAVGSKLLNIAARNLSPRIEPQAASSTVPDSRFNRRVSPHRVFNTARFTLDDLKALRKPAPGSTVNDLVVTLIGGALRHYLDHHGESPAQSLVSVMPVNTRDETGNQSGAENQISLMAAAIGSQIDNPVDRLRFVHEQTSQSKTALAGIGARDLTDINKHIPTALLAAAGKMISTVGFDSAGTGKRLFNMAISNVPGPTQPLYLQGAKLKFWSIVGPLADGMGILFAVTSYNGELFISPTACRDIVPDPDFMLECIERSYKEMSESITKKSATRTARKRRPGERNNA